MSAVREQSLSDATRLRQKGLRVTGPRLAILSTLTQVGGHRAVDELVIALHDAGYHHARTTVYNALDDLANAGLVRAAPVDAGALRYEAAGPPHHHFVCRRCGDIRNMEIAPDLADRPLPQLEDAEIDEFDVVYRGMCDRCTAEIHAGGPLSIRARSAGPAGSSERNGPPRDGPHRNGGSGVRPSEPAARSGGAGSAGWVSGGFGSAPASAADAAPGGLDLRSLEPEPASVGSGHAAR